MSPRPRNTAKKRTTSKKRTTAKKRITAKPKQGALTCPECGRSFTRPAALGAHRRTHGVAGSSSNATRARKARARKTRTAASSSTGRRAPTSVQRNRSAAGAARTRNTGIDRDGLLRTLFPTGIPAREETIRQLNAWLDQAEQLARTR